MKGGRGKPVLISSVDGGNPGLPKNINIFSDIFTMFMCILKSDIDKKYYLIKTRFQNVWKGMGFF